MQPLETQNISMKNYQKSTYMNDLAETDMEMETETETTKFLVVS